MSMSQIDLNGVAVGAFRSTYDMRTQDGKFDPNMPVRDSYDLYVTGPDRFNERPVVIDVPVEDVEAYGNFFGQKISIKVDLDAKRKDKLSVFTAIPGTLVVHPVEPVVDEVRSELGEVIDTDVVG